MFLKGTKWIEFIPTRIRGLASGSSKARAQRKSHTTLVVGLIVLVAVGALVAFEFFPYGNNIVQHWRLKITFHDVRTGSNSTPPANIGVSGGIWMNHTLDPFGPTGFSPISTRDSSGTIYIESNYPAVFTFGDFFNIWGEPFNSSCAWYYCAAPVEPVVYDTNSNNLYDSGEPVIAGTTLSTGTLLVTDSHIKFVDSNNNGVWNPGKTVVYDTDNNGVYDSGEPVINGTLPSTGTPLKSDIRLKFVDTNHDGVWDDAVPLPAMSDGSDQGRCVNRDYGLSDGKDWIIFLHSSLASALNCKP